ncbi:MAG: PD-(D/E)XK nuclease family protein [Woeseiaceae bacterium]
MRENIHLIPYADDPLALLAQHLIQDYSESLPDLTQAVVLISEQEAAQRLRHLLLEYAEAKGFHSLLCPKIFSLRDWAKTQFKKSHAEPICGQNKRELILFDALTEHSALLGSGSPWHLSSDLLQFFDQLTSNQKSLPKNYDEFEKEIAQAYGLSAEDFPSLSHEATLVHHLWHAWHSQLNAEKLFDSEAAYLAGLSADLKYNDDLQNKTDSLYIAGYHQFSVAEKSWLQQRIDQNQCHLYLHGQQHESVTEENSYHPDTPISDLAQYFNFKTNIKNKEKDDYSQFINACYQQNTLPFKERTKAYSHLSSTDISNRLKLLFCNGHEQQAHAVELQVRRWLLAGKTNIGIVTENRRLARRVRALLERADVPLDDLAGWALSTTRVGAVFEKWLECIEDDFSHLALLDLLKSPFIFSQMEIDKVKEATYRLEHDIIRQENISTGLSNYRNAIATHANKLQWSSDINSSMNDILNAFDEANQLLKPLLTGKHPATTFIDNLLLSYDILGMTSLLNEDAAGMRIIEMLETLRTSAKQYPIDFKWSDFRTWVGRSLEKFVFTPEKQSSPVTLMGLGQSRLQQFDALIIASAEQEHLPGKTNTTPFFNNSVRLQLNLSSSHEMLTERFHHFRRCLEAAPDVLITANNEDNGEEVPLSPWLESIHNFYQHTFNASLEDDELKELLTKHNTYVIRSNDKNIPKQTERATTTINKTLLPAKFSPSSYQTLMNCPYQFFAEKCLKLAPSEEVQEALSKSDYGERVHLCLEAFHQNKAGLPNAFNGTVTNTNRDQAIEILTDISNQVFSKDIETQFEHRGWLAQWLKIVPNYIDWQIKNAKSWEFHQAELQSHVEWENKLSLNGRLDRLDKNETGLSVIDYKTGNSAPLADIRQGEAVQLPFYALLAEEELKQPVSQVSYLSVSSKLRTAAQLSGDELDTISHSIGERLSQLIDQMSSGKVLTAWGNETVCQYCNIKRLCRNEAVMDDKIA